MMGLNLHGVRAIYRFEMNRAFRTWAQSLIAPVLSTSLYFIVFGSAIGSRMGDIGGVSYGAYIIPGLLMLSLLSESISNSAFGIYMPKWSGTIYELLSAPVNWVEVVLGYVGAAASKSLMVGALILVTARAFVPYEVAHPLWMVVGALFVPLIAVLVVKRLMGFGAGLKERGVGVLLIEQFTDLALGLSEEAVVLRGGKPRYAGPAKALSDDPALLDAAYFGS